MGCRPLKSVLPRKCFRKERLLYTWLRASEATASAIQVPVPRSHAAWGQVRPFWATQLLKTGFLGYMSPPLAPQPLQTCGLGSHPLQRRQCPTASTVGLENHKRARAHTACSTQHGAVRGSLVFFKKNKQTGNWPCPSAGWQEAVAQPVACEVMRSLQPCDPGTWG